MISNDLLLLMIAIPIGILIGIATGAVGQTANALILPILFMMLGVDLLIAIGSSLLIDFLDTFILSIIYRKKKSLKFKLSVVLGIIGGSVSFLGSYIAFNFLVSLSEVAKILIIIILIGATIIFFRKGFKIKKEDLKKDEDKIQQLEESMTSAQFISSNKKKFAIIFSFSIIYGFLAGLLGVGGGFIMATVLLLLFKKMKTRIGVGTGILYMAIMTGMAVIPYIISFSSEIFYYGFILFGIAAICGTIISAFIVHKISEKKLNFFVAIILIIFTIILIVQQILLS